jgi:hypothetical protein
MDGEAEAELEDVPVTLVDDVETVGRLDPGFNGRADGESADGLPAHDVASAMQASNTTAPGRLTPRSMALAAPGVKQRGPEH